MLISCSLNPTSSFGSKKALGPNGPKHGSFLPGRTAISLQVNSCLPRAENTVGYLKAPSCLRSCTSDLKTWRPDVLPPSLTLDPSRLTTICSFTDTHAHTARVDSPQQRSGPHVSGRAARDAPPDESFARMKSRFAEKISALLMCPPCATGALIRPRRSWAHAFY